jgi:hypothetical protein
MRMPYFATTRQFRAGFIAGLLLFLAANVHSYWSNQCFYEEGLCWFGFPFRWGYGFPFGPAVVGPAIEGLPFRSEIFWGRLAANSLIAIAASTIFGLICNKLFKAKRAFK